MYALAMASILAIGSLIVGLTMNARGALDDASRPHIIAEHLHLFHATALRVCATTSPPSGCATGTITVPADRGPLQGDPRRSRYRSAHDGNGLVITWYESTDPSAGHTVIGQKIVEELDTIAFPGGWIGRRSGTSPLRTATAGTTAEGTSAIGTLAFPTITGVSIPEGAPSVASRFR